MVTVVVDYGGSVGVVPVANFGSNVQDSGAGYTMTPGPAIFPFSQLVLTDETGKMEWIVNPDVALP
jgi:hypothetical protein